MSIARVFQLELTVVAESVREARRAHRAIKKDLGCTSHVLSAAMLAEISKDKVQDIGRHLLEVGLRLEVGRHGRGGLFY